MGKTGWTISALVLLAVVGTTCYFLFAREKEHPQVAPIKEDFKEIAEKQLSPQEMVTKIDKIREEAKDLPDEAKQEVRNAGMEMFRTMINQRVDAYFNAPPEKKKAVLDQQIQEMEMMRKMFETRWAQRQKSQANHQNGQAGQGGPSGNAQANNHQGSQGDRKPPRTEEERQERWQQRRKEWMEKIDPKEKTRMLEYFGAIRDRRKELGLPDWGPRGRGGGPR
ncbi:MAG: hypothetical protein PVH19_12150 [Planctomycetia bacterium]|jgi:hypothetical protein